MVLIKKVNAMNVMNISSSNCITFEDSERGISASNKANIKTIQINDFIKDKSSNVEVSEKLSRILLLIINHTLR